MEARDDALAIVQAVREPLVVLDADCRVGLANDAFYALLGETRGPDRGQAPLGHRPRHLGGPELRQPLKDACRGQAAARQPRDRADAPGPAAHARAEHAGDRARGSAVARAPGRRRRHRRAPGRGAAHRRGDAAPASTSGRTSSSASWRMSCEIRWRRCASRWRSCGAPTATPTEIDAGAAGARPPGHPHGADRRRPARRLAHHAGQSRTAQGAPRAARASSTRPWSSAGQGSTAARHTLTVSLPDETVTLDGDPVRLTQVLVNLLNNAVKFTPPGGHIWLIAETIGERRERPRPGPHPRSRYRRRHRAETCCRRSSTCSCRAIVRSNGRGRASASA